MAQKLQFIVTVMHQPKLLIFDEPFSGFDPINANLIKDEILHLRDEGATVIFSTHRMESVEELCEYIALIDKSNKILDGKLSDIKQQFKSNLFEVVIKSDNVNLVKTDLMGKFMTASSNVPFKEGELAIKIELPNNDTSNNLLSYLSTKGSISHFVEMIPDANEIFIKAIHQNNKNE
jgi:ABC-2 type transport system ATP-binding protein